ncbi:hypothetical protein [Microbacterium koreense]
MADVVFRHSDFTDAVTHLRDAGDAAVDMVCPAFGVVGSAIVESALVGVDGVFRGAIVALAEVGAQLAVDTETVHAELRELDTQMAGGRS